MNADPIWRIWRGPCSHGLRGWRIVSGALVCGILVLHGLGQTPVAFGSEAGAILRTGQGQPLATEVRSFTIRPDLVRPALAFRFAFATDERVEPGVFHDSFTVALQSLDQSFNAILLTVDAFGVTWAPPTPGALVLDPQAIFRELIPFPDLGPVPALRQSYALQAPLPAELADRPLNLYFELFDNQNSLSSLAWFDDVIVVPEPQLWLFAGSLLFLLCTRRDFRHGKHAHHWQRRQAPQNSNRGMFDTANSLTRG